MSMFDPTDQEMGEAQKDFDQFYNSLTHQQKVEYSEALGLADQSPAFPCPCCHQEMAHYRNIGRNHWGVCLDCKVTFWIGSNLFSSWHDEEDSTWEENKVYLSQFEKVEYKPAGLTAE